MQKMPKRAYAKRESSAQPKASKNLPEMSREELGQYVAKIISDDRNSVHGNPHKQFSTQVDVFNRLIQDCKSLNSTQAHAVMQITTKLSRIANGDPDHHDHWIDIAGYALIAAEACGKDPVEL
jgi:hypothetical protein